MTNPIGKQCELTPNVWERFTSRDDITRLPGWQVAELGSGRRRFWLCFGESRCHFMQENIEGPICSRDSDTEPSCESLTSSSKPVVLNGYHPLTQW
ncbi:rCG63565 [Rattus norvegicus]|uniref:RCG63565 n=1 Tax=Rattus norvegicus TaxID=10116 RepID=A6IVM0_RAT|nr:rCG63565 [Rattus norvegicus]